MTGTYDAAAGTVAWSGSATLALMRDGSTITVQSAEGFPAGWTFSDPVPQPDGSWLVTAVGNTTPDTLVIDSLVPDKFTIKDDGTDTATITATVIYSTDDSVQSGVTVSWLITLGSLSSSSSITDSEGLASVMLSALPGTTGEATVMAKLDNGNGKSQIINITDESGAVIIVRGARTSLRPSGQVQPGRLVALDAVTLLPKAVLWGYQPFSFSVPAFSFIDTHPELPLNVGSSTSDYLTLNPSNITGNGVWDDNGSYAGAFTAHRGLSRRTTSSFSPD